MKRFGKKTPPDLTGRLTHLGFIMDGNGRWAKHRGLPREAGHAAGARNLKKLLAACRDRRIAYVTVYAFSTENWRRPASEVEEIMRLISDYLDEILRDREKNRFRVRILGDLTPLSEELVWKIGDVEEQTAQYEDFTLNIALNYGGRQEILTAVNRLLASGAAEVDEKTFSEALYTGGMPDPDLIIRTSGETRVSNFLLWQAAYAEYAFVKTPWPSLSVRELDGIIEDYLKRNRRYGGL